MPKVTEAQKRATAKYEQKNYDRILTRFPKGTKEKIIETGAKSVNSFIIQCVLEALGEQPPAQAPISTVEAPKPAKPKYLPLTPENIANVDLVALKKEIRYQLDIADEFGVDGLKELLRLAREKN